MDKSACIRWKWKVLAGILLFAVALALWLYRLDQVPQTYNVDEVGMAYDAWCLSRFGTDRYGLWLPVYFPNFGGGQNALNTYLCAILFRFFGYSVYTIRLPSFLLNFAGIFCIGKLVGFRYGDKGGIVTTALCLMLPYFFMRQRFGLESNLWLPFMAGGLYVVMKALTEKQNTALFFCAGVIFGLSLYTYAINYMVLPIFLLLLFGTMFYCKKLGWRQVLAMAIPLTILSAPLIAFLIVNALQLGTVKTPFFTIPQLKYFRGGELGKWNLQKGIIQLFKIMLCYDRLGYNSTAKFGVFYYVSIPFILAGGILSAVSACRGLKKHCVRSDAIVWMLLLAIIPAAIATGELCCNRINAIYLCTAYFLAVGLLTFCCRLKPLRMQISGVMGKIAWEKLLVSGVYLVLFAVFLNWYFTEEQRYIFFYQDMDEAYAKASAHLTEQGIIRTEPLLDGSNIYYLLAAKVPPEQADMVIDEPWGHDIEGVVKFNFPEIYDPRDVYIVSEDDVDVLRQLDSTKWFEASLQDGYWVYYGKQDEIERFVTEIHPELATRNLLTLS